MAVHNDKVMYKKCMVNCAKYGQSLIDEDIQAGKEAGNATMPNDVMLKARLLLMEVIIQNVKIFSSCIVRNL
ncbi:MAG: hypothetical protein IPP49_01150 [Saprospiraceae bacterium]|nr:hypothetical protein [Saprospiraceae bacterium]